jgi:hypothetical protein
MPSSKCKYTGHLISIGNNVIVVAVVAVVTVVADDVVDVVDVADVLS